MDAVKFLKGRERMCDRFSVCADGCPLYSNYTDCNDYITNHIEEAVAFVEKWVAEHPAKTRKDDFFEKFPNAPTDERTLPRPCVKVLGYTDECTGKCEECWNESVY